MTALDDGHVNAGPKKQMGSSFTLGDPDGPDVFVPSLGREVPSYIDPRIDLIPGKRAAAIFQRLNYHVPFKMRGVYKPEWLPSDYAQHMGEAGEITTNFEGFVMCSAYTKGTGAKCGNLAVNRTNVCRNHGGALHPADKKLSGESLMLESVMKNHPERIERMDRVQKFMQGLLPMEDLSDDEIVGAYVLNDEGRPVASVKLGAKLQQGMVRELHRRMNSYMQMKLPKMLKRVAEIAESDLVEPETSFKAAVWMAERQMGKTPEVLIHAATGAPYEAILDSVESGSREDYRKSIESTRGASQPLAVGSSGTPGVYSEDGEPLDVFEVDEGELDPEDEGFDSGFLAGQGSSVDDGERSDSNVATLSNALSRAEAIEEKAKRAREIIAARKKAQKRRYAARATGSSTVTDMWWLPTFKKNMVMRKGVKVQMGWRCLLVCPDDQSEQLLARMAASGDNHDDGS